MQRANIVGKRFTQKITIEMRRIQIDVFLTSTLQLSVDRPRNDVPRC